MVRSKAALASLAVIACRGPQSALDPAGPQAAALHDLWNVMLVGGSIVFAIVIGLVLIAVKLPAMPIKARRWLRAVLSGVIATVVILFAMLLYNIHVSRVITAEPADPIRIQVVGHQWWWEVIYTGEPPSQSVRTANEIWIPVGRPVEISLQSRDVIHSFWVPNLHGKLDAVPGHTRRLWLQADQPGTYRGQCAEFCGLQHANMSLHVVAVQPADYEAWLAGQLRPATPPADPQAERGLAVFQQTCAKCHALRGTLAMAAAAPDLTHLASRRTLAAGMLPNHRGQLAGWILDPQRIKPGAYMPPIELESTDLHALLHYLESLR